MAAASSGDISRSYSSPLSIASFIRIIRGAAISIALIWFLTLTSVDSASFSIAPVSPYALAKTAFRIRVTPSWEIEPSFVIYLPFSASLTTSLKNASTNCRLAGVRISPVSEGANTSISLPVSLLASACACSEALMAATACSFASWVNFTLSISVCLILTRTGFLAVSSVSLSIPNFSALSLIQFL